jgi:uncharacterized protein (DUF885 family)
MTTSRRDFLIGTGATIAASAVPVRAFAAAPDAAAEAMLAGIAEELLVDYPENATSLGLDSGTRAALKSKLTDRSPAGQERIAERSAKRLSRLTAIAPAALSPATRTDVDVVRAAHEWALEGFAFPFGDSAMLNQSWSFRNAPYVVTQNTGAFVEIPSLLDTGHTIETPADADAYLARIEAYAGQLDGETERLRHDGARSVIAPDFILDQALAQLAIARGGDVAGWSLVTSLGKRTAKMPGDYAARAAKLAADMVAPALDRQISQVKALRARANPDAGVWKLPDGEAYYAWALRAGTTTRMPPDEVHAMGLDQIKALQSEMDVILRKQGLTQGTVGERMTALGKDPRYLYPNDDAGRAQIVAYMNDRLSDIRARMPRAFATLVPGHLEVRRMAPEVEPGAPGAYGGPGTIDGKVPGKIWINLGTTALWTRYSLPTLAYHEGIPGHVWQGEYTFKLPLVRSLLAFNAYSEGWALYAEQLAGELGVYDDDPVGRLGYLQSIAFRACRLVVDTGIHAKRWTRGQAVQWFMTTNGSGLDEVQSEVDRYCVWPGQACGYKVGHSEINRLRDHAKAVLGERFDFPLFNDAVVKGGGMPMTVLGRTIDAYIAARKRA